MSELVRFEYLTGTLTIKPGKWRIEPYQETRMERRWFRTKAVTETLYRLVPDNEFAYIEMSNIGSIEEAISAKYLLERN